MSRENFIAALDDDPSNQQLRAVFADWLEENGEAVLAAGLRWMAANNKYPYEAYTDLWDWFNHPWAVPPSQPHHANINVLEHMQGTWWIFGHPSRQAAEESLALALWEQGITGVKA